MHLNIYYVYMHSKNYARKVKTTYNLQPEGSSFLRTFSSSISPHLQSCDILITKMYQFRNMHTQMKQRVHTWTTYRNWTYHFNKFNSQNFRSSIAYQLFQKISFENCFKRSSVRRPSNLDAQAPDFTIKL